MNDKYLILKREALELNTFITIIDPLTVLIVENLKHRLVITLPNTVHSLKVKHSNIILKSNTNI